MVNLKKISLNHQLKSFLAEVFLARNMVNPKLTLGLSGGLDSIVLLHLLCDCKQLLPFQLRAHHVHHGLSPNADAWAAFCAEACKKRNIPFMLSKIKVNKNSGLGLEAAARDARPRGIARAAPRPRREARRRAWPQSRPTTHAPGPRFRHPATNRLAPTHG